MGARPSGFDGAAAEAEELQQFKEWEARQVVGGARPEPTWSEEQQVIFDYFAAGPTAGHLMVDAVAGSGKTTTIVEGVKRAPERNPLCVAFNKKIADALNEKLVDSYASAKTLHSLGYAMIRRQWKGMPMSMDGERAESIVNAVLGKDKAAVPKLIYRMIVNLQSKAREICPLTWNEAVLWEVGAKFDLLPDEQGWGKYGPTFVIEKVGECLSWATENEPTREIGIDYPDMIFLPLVWNLAARDYDMVVVDERQDMTAAQLDLAMRACSGRIVLVGDKHQCQPAGTMVRVSDRGDVPIEGLQVGDTVETFDRHGQVFIKSGTVTATKARPYSGFLVKVSADDKTTRCTPNHKWLVRWTNKSTPTWITYLMRQGNRWRVGQTQLFRHTTKDFGLSVRARVERADDAWILKTHESLSDALAHEAIVSTVYGLPQMVFHPPSNIKYFTQAVIDTVYGAFDEEQQRQKAEQCLVNHFRDVQFPIYRKAEPFTRRGRTTLFETQACNLLGGYMSVAVAPVIITGHDKRDRHAVQWSPLSIQHELFQGLVYSLNIAKHHKYVADGLVTCNSIYGFRGADVANGEVVADQLGAANLPLTVSWRCDEAIIADAQRLVPHIQAREGAGQGVVDTAHYDDMLRDVKVGDFILSRLNAPLVTGTLHLLKGGTRARMAGRDIGQGILKLLRRLKIDATTPISQADSRVHEWEQRERQRFAARGLLTEVNRIIDTAGMLYAFIEDSETTRGMVERIEALFTDEQGPYVLLSSVHKAKGLEAERVWILQESFYRFGEDQEEHNILYVAITRAKHHLTKVTGVPSLQKQEWQR